MLTSNPGNQYLHPDYLSPAATTLDAKNSPLALLAQTCSSIGADNTNSKFFICIEKKNHKTRELKEKCSPANDNFTTSSTTSVADNNDHIPQIGFKPYEPTTYEKSTAFSEERCLSEIKTPNNSVVASTNGRCKSNQSATSEKETPIVTCRLTLEDRRKIPTCVNTPSNSGVVHSLEENLMARLFYPVDPTSSMISTTSSKISDIRSGFCSTGGYPSSLPYPVDFITANAFLTTQHNILRNSVSSSLLHYGRLKDATRINNGISTLCKDPYCKCCPPNTQERGQLCASGCNQCDQATLSQSYQEGTPTNATNIQEQFTAFTSNYPYACNWIGADSYCGKRFLTSEELFHHLQVHTAESTMTPLTGSFPHSQDLLQRIYFSSSLSSITHARYHPYSKPPIITQGLSVHPEIPYPYYPLYGSSISNGSIHQ